MNLKNPNSNCRRVSLFGRDVEDLFSQVVSAFENSNTECKLDASFTPRADIAETDSGYELTLELPGVSAENIDVEYHDGVLTITGQRSHESQTSDLNKKFHRIERQFGSFARRFRLKDVDGERIVAECKDGLLTVHAAKVEAAKPKKVAVR